ncbi:MAG: excinuclease ABC subunit UvrC [Gammaproteobacteria bacterium]|nr:excinuclease ABC subunit UvrC [Gammaproteobacteria bacterium]MCW8987736.1 excinuclease ABC subunit UvrC [Gammaproteobacteria bacterium]MCW9029942.1 excinuclease ABC subunit UvrC [Gammaproteobacteria bacterium]
MPTAPTEFDAKAALRNIPNKPGVYRMLDEKACVIYVGKAKNLKKRVSSYFLKNVSSPKTRVMVSHILDIEVTVTHTENEALILENNLIKSLKPRYNVLFRDDKSYPFIYLSSEHAFPRLGVHRGAKKKKGRYFGPYPSAGAVRETLNLLQKIFPVRQCEDSFYSNRSRACLQHQIKRCTAPCVGLISEEEYAEDVNHAVMFLQGKSNDVINQLITKMEHASEKLNFEKAAHFRDQIANLQRIQEKQYIDSEGGDQDIIATALKNGLACVQIFSIRGGRNLGNKTFYPQNAKDSEAEELISTFIAQYYLGDAQSDGREIPSDIIISHEIENTELMEHVLKDQCDHVVKLQSKPRGQRARWLDMAIQNVNQALQIRLNSHVTVLQRYEALQTALQLDEMPTRMECFDISHTMGEATVASCVVFDEKGPLKADYRRFNIDDITPGDDYAAMKQALMRRYKRLKEGEAKLPDILFIDGGKGQVSQAEEVLEELQINDVLLIGVTKGEGRNPDLDTLYLSASKRKIILPPDSPALHLTQQIRDEAHRFAISGHRNRRAKKRKTSVLEGIPGLGPKRRQQLLKQFGGLQEVTRAGVEDIARVPGISKQLAKKIYDTFHMNNEN